MLWMLWTIIKRELYDHINSLRFTLTVGLITLLMILNGLLFINGDYRRRLEDYHSQTARVTENIRHSSKSLRDLARNGPVDLYLKPSPFSFASTGQEEALPIRIQASYGDQWGHYHDGRVSGHAGHYTWVWPWRLEYVQDTHGKDSAFGMLVSLDWAFIVGVVISFVALVFTFDAISGEREQGTLALVVSNPVPLSAILLGKFLATFIAIAVPLMIGLLISLFAVVLSGVVSLAPGDWLRLGAMVGLSLVYLAIFIGVGLAVSARFRYASTCLLVLLVVWVGFVVLVPNTLGSLAGTLGSEPDDLVQEWNAVNRQLGDDLWQKSRYKGKPLFEFGSPSDNPLNPKALERWAEFMNGFLDTQSRFEDSRLRAQFKQVEVARGVLRISPTAIYRFAMEALAGAGFPRHKLFVKAAQQYREQFVTFIKEKDAADPESFHVYPLKEGLSTKPVSFEDIPRFEEPTGVEVAMRTALFDMGLLLLMAGFTFMLSYVVFLRCEVK